MLYFVLGGVHFPKTKSLVTLEKLNEFKLV